MDNQNTKELIDLVLHPVRMRLILLFSSQPLTAQQAGSVLTDVPQASLYRHIRALYEAGILQVVEERPVRGTLEKVYVLNSGAGQVSADDLAGLSKEDHLRMFISFMSSQLHEFERYLRSVENVDYVKDGVGFQSITLNISDEELVEMSKAINAAIIPLLTNQPSQERRTRIFSSILLPAGQPVEPANGEEQPE